MAKKFIIVKGELRAASAIDYHLELLPKNITSEEISKVRGGWWEFDQDKKEVTFFGSSGDFGPVTKEQLIEVIQNDGIGVRKWWDKDIRFFYTHWSYGIKIEDPAIMANRVELIYDNNQICL